MEDVHALLRNFIQGPDRSIAAANRIEVALARHFPEDERFADLELALASYRPGGGERLYDEARILPVCQAALDVLSELRLGQS